MGSIQSSVDSKQIIEQPPFYTTSYAEQTVLGIAPADLLIRMTVLES